MKPWSTALAVVALALCGAPTAFAQATPMGATVASDGNCPATQVVNPGNGRPVYANKKGGVCTDGSGGSTTITGGFDATTTATAFTIATGGTFQTILAANGSRKGCLIQNPITATEILFVFFGANGSATTGASIGLSPGSAISCAIGGLGTASDNISATATTTSHAGVVLSQ